MALPMILTCMLDVMLAILFILIAWESLHRHHRRLHPEGDTPRRPSFDDVIGCMFLVLGILFIVTGVLMPVFLIPSP